jgi:hypothetical protein
MPNLWNPTKCDQNDSSNGYKKVTPKAVAELDLFFNISAFDKHLFQTYGTQPSLTKMIATITIKKSHLKLQQSLTFCSTYRPLINICVKLMEPNKV